MKTRVLLPILCITWIVVLSGCRKDTPEPEPPKTKPPKTDSKPLAYMKKAPRTAKRASRGTPINLKKLEKDLDTDMKNKGMLNALGGGKRISSVIGAKGIGGADMKSLGGWDGNKVRSYRGMNVGGGGGGLSGDSAGLGKLGTFGLGGGHASGSDKKAKRPTRRKFERKIWKGTKGRTILSRVSVGGKKYLKLKKLRVTVQVEGLRVRTILDHIYFNPHHRTLEGTFKYTLPPDSSVSYYAMFVGQSKRTPRFFGKRKVNVFRLARLKPGEIARRASSVWGKLRVARLVAAEKGRRTFEVIARRRIDPALLEQDAPNTFQGRVFPIQSRGYNRVILAYEQTLASFQKQRLYKFHFPKGKPEFVDFSVQYNSSLSQLAKFDIKHKGCSHRPSKSNLRCVWEKKTPPSRAVLYFRPRQSEVQWTAGQNPVSRARYLYGQARISLPVAQKRFGAKQAVFLLDTSLSTTPRQFTAYVLLLKKILRNNAHIQRFNIMTFDLHTNWMAPRWMTNNKAQRKKLFATLEQVLLEGATHGETVFQELARPAWLRKRGLNLDVFVLSDARWSWGQKEPEVLLQRFEKHSHWGKVRFFGYQTGLSSENLRFLRTFTRKGGSVFSCLGRSELDRCSTAHTKPVFVLKKLEIKGVRARETLIAGRQTTFYPGALLTFASRYSRRGKVTLLLHGHYLGKPKTLQYSFSIRKRGSLAPRAWAELAVQQLIGLQNEKHRELIVAYSQHYRLSNKYCSFLVLETDREYKLYKLEKQQRQSRLSNMESFLAAEQKKKGRLPDWRQRWKRMLKRLLGESTWRNKRSFARQLAAIPNKELSLATSSRGRLWTKKEVPASYLKTRRSSLDFEAFFQESKRRLRDKKLQGAIKALSSIVELHPSNPKALRMVGVMLNVWKHPELAAPLFWKVLQRRSFEAASLHSLARTLQFMKRERLAALLYEVLLWKNWSGISRRTRKVFQEEYILLRIKMSRSEKLPYALRRSAVYKRYAKDFDRIYEELHSSKIRVVVTWNTNDTDMDLWVNEPGGERCYYQHKKTAQGGELLEDVTRGYGPERYHFSGRDKGEFRIRLKYYGASTNTFGNQTLVSVVVTLYPGTKAQKVSRYFIRLKKQALVRDVARIKVD